MVPDPRLAMDQMWPAKIFDMLTFFFSLGVFRWKFYVSIPTPLSTKSKTYRSNEITNTFLITSPIYNNPVSNRFPTSIRRKKPFGYEVIRYRVTFVVSHFFPRSAARSKTTSRFNVDEPPEKKHRMGEGITVTSDIHTVLLQTDNNEKKRVTPTSNFRKLHEK